MTMTPMSIVYVFTFYLVTWVVVNSYQCVKVSHYSDGTRSGLNTTLQNSITKSWDRQDHQTEVIMQGMDGKAISTLKVEQEMVSLIETFGLGKKAISTLGPVNTMGLGGRALDSVEKTNYTSGWSITERKDKADLTRIYLVFGWLWSSYLTAIGTSFYGY